MTASELKQRAQDERLKRRGYRWYRFRHGKASGIVLCESHASGGRIFCREALLKHYVWVFRKNFYCYGTITPISFKEAHAFKCKYVLEQL